MRLLSRLIVTVSLSLGLIGTLSAPAGAGDEAPMPAACCKVCHAGKACGNSCIARNKTCTQPPGCACDG